jgi:uncharacterized membrane protein
MRCFRASNAWVSASRTGKCGEDLTASSSLLQTEITLLCGVGVYVSLFMLRKSRLAEHGNLEGPSVVKERHARLFFGLPNSLFGSLYYPLLAAAVWLYPYPRARWFIVLPVIAAAATSLFLAHSLLFVTKRPCPYCWITHVVNWLLLCVLLFGASRHG